MQYRKFGRLDWRVSALGFGAMRLPTTDGKVMTRNIDVGKSVEMIRRAIDDGVNYIDTAYVYHQGRGEAFVSKVLREGYRDEVGLATKSPVWDIKKESDFDKFLDHQLKRLRTDHIDFYLLHALNKDTWKDNVVKKKVLKNAERAKSKGKIRYLGFSFHDSYDVFKRIIDAHDWDFCQIQYNYMDIDNQAGTKGLKYAYSKGLGVVIMEPLLGGRLANPPPIIRRLIKRSGISRTPADLALQWLWSQPEVSVVLSGMSTMNQVTQNLRSADNSRIGLLTKKELAAIKDVRRAFLERTKIPCTKCGYCEPCPQGVAIPINFEIYNDVFMYSDLKGSKRNYSLMRAKRRASACKQCRRCEKKCPQKIAISELMPKVDELLRLDAD